jgi:hypothetical protein
LNQKQVEYLLIGGFAVAYHGFPRATFDIDFLISFSKKNIEKVQDVLKEFGFGFEEIYQNEFWDKSKIFRMGYPPVRIELMFQASGIEFEECYQNRIIDIIDNIEISIISLKDLKINKISARRHKDLYDIENLP